MRKKRINIELKYLLGIIITSLFMGIGYASVNNVVLNITGTVNSIHSGDVKIILAEKEEELNVSATDPTITDDYLGITFNISLTANKSDLNNSFYAIYKFVIENDSVEEHKVQADNFTPTITGDASTLNVTYSIEDENGNMVNNVTVPAKTTQTYYLTINLYPTAEGSWDVGGETGIENTDEEEGDLLGSIPRNSEGNLRGTNTRARFTATVLNTYTTSKTFNFSIDNSRFKIVDANGNDLQTMTINANDTQDFDFYIQRVNNDKFPSDEVKLNVYFEGNDNKTSMGIVNLLVDKDNNLTDNEAPVIKNVQAKINKTVGQIDVSWEGSDNVEVDHYIVEVHRSNANGDDLETISTNTVSGTSNTYQATGLAGGNYYFFKVYGVDKATPPNTATSEEISTCPVSSSNDLHCASSSNNAYKWNFTITFNLTNAASSEGNTINVTYDGNASTTLSGTDNRERPSSITSATITYADGSSGNLPSGNSSQTAYNYNANNGTLNLYHITGDVTITASGEGNGTCLAKGTKILLANGKTKNVEDINYDDLLTVWNYDTGTITYEYPLWIEKEQTGSNVTKVIFDDNTYIKFVGDHAVYDTKLNSFISILDKDKFHVGISIAKIENNKFVSKKVKEIQKIKENTLYYFIGSTTYYNVIANDVLTTDRHLVISNLYGFNDNATWPKEKIDLLNNPNNIMEYDELKNVLPYYLYKGFRARELGYLINQNMISLEAFIYALPKLILDSSMIQNPINKDNHNYWMVTTSEDNVTDYNKNLYLQKEGSIYTLPSPNKLHFKGWLNTSDNQIYQPNDKVMVYHGMHFIAIYN